MTAPLRKSVSLVFASLALFVAALVNCAAQSTDVSRPTPLFSNEVGGRIAPRDIGDARLTRHFYAFTGNEGDLFVTVESNDLNGDIDVFTASTLRPLLKITVFPTSSGYFVKKSVYLRRDESLILRVEGRASGETEARYRIKLEGAFGPASGAFAQMTEEAAPPDASETAAEPRKGRRTTSTGARIAEPVTEAAAQPTPSPEPPAETGTETATTPTETRPSTSRRNRGTRNTARTPTRRTRPAARDASEPDTAAGEEKATTTDKPAEERAAEATEASPARTTRTNPTRRTGRGRPRPAPSAEARVGAETNAGEPAATTEPAPEPSTRLVIVTKDGETIERDMKTVRRVTVERGQIVIVGMDGRVSRQPLSNVVRMAIEP